MRRQEPHTHQMVPSPQSHSLGVVVAILSVDIKFLALRKDGGGGNKNDFRVILI